MIPSKTQKKSGALFGEDLIMFWALYDQMRRNMVTMTSTYAYLLAHTKPFSRMTWEEQHYVLWFMVAQARSKEELIRRMHDNFNAEITVLEWPPDPDHTITVREMFFEVIMNTVGALSKNGHGVIISVGGVLH